MQLKWIYTGTDLLLNIMLSVGQSKMDRYLALFPCDFSTLITGLQSFDPRHKKQLFLGFPTRFNTNQAVEPQKMRLEISD